MTSAREFGLNVVKVSGGQELILCPWHHDRKPSAWWSPKKNLFWCSVCNMGLNEVQLRRRLHLPVDNIGDNPQELEDFNLFEEVIDLPRGTHEWTDYVRGRGILHNTMYTYNVETTEDTVIFPFTNLVGTRTGVMIRYTKPALSGTRYKIVGERQPLWPMYWLKNPACRPRGYVILTEGAFSAMRLHQASGWWPMALMGAKASRELFDLLAPFKPVFLYDADLAGKNACKKMRGLGAEHAYVLPVSPDDMNTQELDELVAKVDKLCKG